MDTKRLTKQRRMNFSKWWKKNHHREKAHTWLAFHARQTVFTYAMTPEVFGHVQTLTKRFFKSEHKRMSQLNAWTLWKLTHPLHFERVARITTHAEFLKIQNNIRKENKKEGNK